MRKFLLIILAAGLLFSCQKKADETAILQEVSFSAIQVNPDGLKSTEEWPCKADVPTHAWVTINGVDYYPELFTLDGVLYTQAIKFPVGSYSITKFILYKEVDGVLGCDVNAVPNPDIVVFGTPVLDINGNPSPFVQYINPAYRFPYTFTVGEFVKTQVPIEVLCYQDAYYDKFGFNWFAITEIVIREQCFFGDVCFKHFLDYAQSNYALQPGGLKIDMPAIMQLVVKKNGVEVPFSPFTNDVAPNYGVGAPLCIQYPDNLSINGEVFTVDLYILLKVGTGFNFVKFHTWTFTDAQMIVPAPPASDGVVDFVLGNCNLTDPDLQLAPYMNLPVQAGLTTGGVVPSVTLIQGQPGYFDVTLSGIGAGYDITNMMYAINCFNRGVTINLGAYYLMNVYSSLYPQYMQGPCKNLNWNAANWLINHLNNFPGYVWSDVQQAFWKIEDPTWNMAANAYVPAGGAIALAMYNAAVAPANANYVPLPGGWAGVAFEHATDPIVQCVFLRVDPSSISND